MTYEIEIINQEVVQLLKSLEQLQLIRVVNPSKKNKDKPQARPIFGCAKGKFRMADDFDAPIDHFEEYMP